MREAPPSSEAARGPRYRCPPSARWLPRVLGAAVLAATLVAAYAVDPRGALPRSAMLRGLLAVVGAGLALWIVRKGAEVRTQVVLGREGVEFRSGRGRAALAYADIGALDRAPSFGPWRPSHEPLGRRARVLDPVSALRNLAVAKAMAATSRLDLGPNSHTWLGLGPGEGL